MNIGEQLESTEGTIQLVLVVAGLGILAWIVYEVATTGEAAYSAFDSLLQKLGIATDSGGMDQPSQIPGQKTVAQSVGGYDKIGASGQMWSCTGPVGSASDMCTAISCDANGSCTFSNTVVPAAQAN